MLKPFLLYVIWKKREGIMKYPLGLLPDLDLGVHAFMALMQLCYFLK